MNTNKGKLLKLTELRYHLLPFMADNIKDDADITGDVLKCHLFSEVLLEEMIKIVFEKNSEAILSVNLSYNQKLLLVSKLNLFEDFELLPDYIVGSLRKLNKLRNRLAHRIGESVSDTDIAELFVGMEKELPYGHILENGHKIALKRYMAFIFGNILPKYESIEELRADTIK